MVTRSLNFFFVGVLVAGFFLETAGGQLPPTSPEVSLRAEFNKSEIYVGETVVANFVLYAKDDMVEAEVAKFPEFRGYWSENTSLRQGPLSLLPEPHPGPWKRVLIGSYILTPMIGKDQPTIEPMKIVVRRPLGFNAEQRDVYLSEIAPLKLKPLPPVPEPLRAFFGGAVGRFAFFVDNPQLPFQKDEPTPLHLVVQGEGNFQEINEIPLNLPPEVEVLSKKSYLQGATQFPTKTFEYTLALHLEKDIELSAVPFVYFNPFAKKYEVLHSAPLRFHYVPMVAGQASPERAVFNLGAPESDFSLTYPLPRSIWFWGIQGAALLVLMGLGAARRIGRARTEKRERLVREQSRGLAPLRALYQAPDLEVFLRRADEEMYEWARAKLGLRRRPTRAEVLREATRRLDPNTTRRIAEVFSSYQSLAYSPAKACPLNKEDIWKAAREVLS